MKPRRWFLPETPDVLGLLRHQLEVTIERGRLRCVGQRRCRGGAGRARRRACGGQAKRELLSALRAAFVTPLEPEDVFALSRGVDRIQRHTRDLVNESEAMDCRPDAGIAEMANLFVQALRHIEDAIASLGSDGGGDRLSRCSDRGRTTARARYYEGMAALLEVGDRHERIARRELYRRCSRIGETVVEVAERVVYAVVKQT